jgi:hypothetical protein
MGKKIKILKRPLSTTKPKKSVVMKDGALEIICECTHIHAQYLNFYQSLPQWHSLDSFLLGLENDDWRYDIAEKRSALFEALSKNAQKNPFEIGDDDSSRDQPLKEKRHFLLLNSWRFLSNQATKSKGVQGRVFHAGVDTAESLLTFNKAPIYALGVGALSKKDYSAVEKRHKSHLDLMDEWTLVMSQRAFYDARYTSAPNYFYIRSNIEPIEDNFSNLAKQAFAVNDALDAKNGAKGMSALVDGDFFTDLRNFLIETKAIITQLDELDKLYDERLEGELTHSNIQQDERREQYLMSRLTVGERLVLLTGGKTIWAFYCERFSQLHEQCCPQKSFVEWAPLWLNPISLITTLNGYIDDKQLCQCNCPFLNDDSIEEKIRITTSKVDVSVNGPGAELLLPKARIRRAYAEIKQTPHSDILPELPTKRKCHALTEYFEWLDAEEEGAHTYL